MRTTNLAEIHDRLEAAAVVSSRGSKAGGIGLRAILRFWLGDDVNLSFLKCIGGDLRRLRRLGRMRVRNACIRRGEAHVFRSHIRGRRFRSARDRHRVGAFELRCGCFQSNRASLGQAVHQIDRAIQHPSRNDEVRQDRPRVLNGI